MDGWIGREKKHKNKEPVFNDVVRSDNSRRAGEARFDGFGPLSGQNGPPERARSTAKHIKRR